MKKYRVVIKAIRKSDGVSIEWGEEFYVVLESDAESLREKHLNWRMMGWGEWYKDFSAELTKIPE